jgi:hypothetical protein
MGVSLIGSPELPQNDQSLKNTLVGEEWMALRQIASGGKAASYRQILVTGRAGQAAAILG